MSLGPKDIRIKELHGKKILITLKFRDRLVGLDKVFENRNRHHRIRRQILRKYEGL